MIPEYPKLIKMMQGNPRLVKMIPDDPKLVQMMQGNPRLMKNDTR